MHTNLRTFLTELKKEQELKIIDVPVDPYLELAEIHRRVISEEGPALLFTQVKGSSFPVVTNLFGTSRRVSLAFGTRPETLVKKIIQLIPQLMPPKPSMLWKERSLLKDLLRLGTKPIPKHKAPVLACQQPEVNLHQLPVITSWQEDGGPFVTLPLVYTEHPVSHEHNLGMYRMQIFDKNTTGMHWQIHKGGGFHYSDAESRNHSLPVHVFLGGPPALIASAIAPLPEMFPELLLTSLIMGEKVPVYQSENGYPCIAEAEFILSGMVPHSERRMEGPFGDHYGYYSLEHPFPVFHVNQVFHRKDAIYPATVVGKPKQEDYYLGEFLQKLLSPAFPIVMPGIKKLWTYAETGFHSLTSAVVRESYQREILVHGFRILGEGQLSLTKILMLTDQDVDLEDFVTLFESILERFQPETDLLIFNNTSMDTLDYTGRLFNKGSKAIIVGTGDPVRSLPSSYDGPILKGIDRIEVFCKGVLVLEAPDFKTNPNLAEEIIQVHGDPLQKWPFVFLVDSIKAAKDQASFLWTIFTRFDPAHDIYARSELVRHHPNYRLPIIVDARMKPGYPDELEPDHEVVNQVNHRWKEYFSS